MNNHWLKLRGKWYFKIERPIAITSFTVTGWYQDEKEAYFKAENRRQFLISPLDMYSKKDYWDIVMPFWYLHRNGKWFKNACLFKSYDEAELTWLNSLETPSRYKGYQEYLDEQVKLMVP